MASTTKIFIDTSGFKAFIDPKDDFYAMAARMMVNFQLSKPYFVTSNYVIDETATLIRSRCKKEIFLNFKEYLINSRILHINRVTHQDEAEAWIWMEKDWSRLSFTDCVSFAQLKRLEINRVFGFDHHFEQAGFILEK